MTGETRRKRQTVQTARLAKCSNIISLCLHLLSYSLQAYGKFFLNLHLIFIQSSNLREFQLLVSCIIFPINWKFLFQFRVNRKHGQTDGQTDEMPQLSPRYKCTLAARWRSKNARSLLVLRVMRRQRRAMCVFCNI